MKKYLVATCAFAILLPASSDAKISGMQGKASGNQTTIAELIQRIDPMTVPMMSKSAMHSLSACGFTVSNMAPDTAKMHSYQLDSQLELRIITKSTKGTVLFIRESAKKDYVLESLILIRPDTQTKQLRADKRCWSAQSTLRQYVSSNGFNQH